MQIVFNAPMLARGGEELHWIGRQGGDVKTRFLRDGAGFLVRLEARNFSDRTQARPLRMALREPVRGGGARRALLDAAMAGVDGLRRRAGLFERRIGEKFLDVGVQGALICISFDLI